MTIQELFIESNKALKAAIDQIKQDQWELNMPPGTSSKPSTLIAAVQYHTYDDAWVPDVLAGKNKDEVGAKYDFLLTNDSVIENYDIYNQRARDAVAIFSNLQHQVHLSYGDFPARDYLQHIISFRAFRSYDIAKMIGIDTTMDSEFVDALLDEFSPVVEQYRKMGVFPVAVAVPEDSDKQTKLLGMVGRK